MLIRKAFKYKLKTSAKTAGALAQFAGCNRFVWNKALAMQKERLEQKEYCHSYYELATLLRDWKKDEETGFLKQCPSQSLQQTLKNLSQALKDAFSKKSPKRFPVFKRKGQSDSFRIPQNIKLKDNKVFVPKLGYVPFFKSRTLVGIPKNATVSKGSKGWYISIQCEIEQEQPSLNSASTIGIDVGVKKFVSCSDGVVFKPINAFKTQQKKLAKEQRKLSRKVKGSKNFGRQKRKVQLVHSKIAATRNDYLHKVSTTLSKNHAMVVLEDLKIANMSRSMLDRFSPCPK